MADQDKPQAPAAPAGRVDRKGQKKVTVKLAVEHEHGGELHLPGSEIEVWPDQAERLRRQGKLAA